MCSFQNDVAIFASGNNEVVLQLNKVHLQQIPKYSSTHCSNKNHHSLCLCPKVGLTLNKFRATIYWQQYSNYLQATGSKGVNCFMLLPTHNRVHQAFPDLMHDLKNVIVTFFDLITGKGDSKKVRVADKRALTVSVPLGYGWKPSAFFCKKVYLKSHDWKQVNIYCVVRKWYPTFKDLALLRCLIWPS